MAGLKDRLEHAWNAFVGRDNVRIPYPAMGASYGMRPDRVQMSFASEKSIVASVYTRIAIDAAATSIRHVRTDQNERYIETLRSSLNECLSTEANLDQSGRAFFQDVFISMFDEGSVAIVPVETSMNPAKSASYDILSLRVGKVIEWYPKHVKVRLYNDRSGQREELVVLKKTTAIVENPLYAVMNEPNSTLQRLIRKLMLLDAVDEQTSSGKLDILIQLPYVIKTETRRLEAEKRRKDIEAQLSGSKYGIAYIDGTERVTQLNRPAENNLMKQVEYLTAMLYGQLGLTEEVFKGTADERTMLNYYNRTIEPVISAVTDEMKRKFLTKTARTQYQSIMAFRDPFRLVPVSDIAEIADKFTRNEILSSNDVRAIIGYRPSDNPRAEELVNKNVPQPGELLDPTQAAPEGEDPEG